MTIRIEKSLAQGTVRLVYEGEPELAAGALTRFCVHVEADFDLPSGTLVGMARRWPCDWGTPQAGNPAAVDYLRVVASPGRQLRWWSADQHRWHPYDHVLLIELPQGLAASECLSLMAGEAAQGCPGFTVQTFIEEASALWVRLRRPSDPDWIEIGRPTVRIAGAAPHRLVLTAPSCVGVNQPFEIHLRVEDEWGNPSKLDRPVRLASPLNLEVNIPDCGWLRVDAVLPSEGVFRLAAQVAGDSSLSATGNPVEVVGGVDVRPVYWGDPHAQSIIGCGARSIDAFYRHAREFAATDFASHQANCFLVSRDEWALTERGTAAVHEDGRFVALLGVEWSAISSSGGDHNLYFPGDTADLHRCSHEFVDDKSDLATDLPHVVDLHAHYRGTDVLVAVHVGGRTADLRWHEPSLDRLLEVHSTHATSEWFLLDALRRGYRMGVVAGSDGVDGRPGASHPGHLLVRNVRNGLTAVAMPELTRAGLWSALKARRCYATTGERILLRWTAGAAEMGDEIVAGQLPSFDVHVEGTAPIESIDFYCDDRIVSTVDLMAGTTEMSDLVRVAWCGASAPGNFRRARMRWDGVLRIDGARILDVQPWAFDTPDEGLRGFDEHRASWCSITGGDWDGLILQLDDFSNAELTFATDPMTLGFGLGDLGAQPHLIEDRSPMRKVEVRRLPRQMPALGWRGSFDAPPPVAGSHAYWVRVRQADGAFAWSTPIFVTLNDDPAR